MARPTARPTQPELDPDPGDSPVPSTLAAPTPAASAALGSLADLPVAGLTRRRIALLLGALVAAWVIVLFARQVGEASDAASRADQMRAANATLEGDVAALERELAMIQRQDYIEQQAREYRLGSPREVPFILEDDAPPLTAEAPGSASVRLGAQVDRPTPLESWLNLLFGPPGDPASPLDIPAG